MPHHALDIRSESLSSAVAQQLIAALNAELAALYPEEGANHFRLDEAEVAPGRGVFLVCRSANRLAGCGALRTLDATTAELKRMYVVPELRGQGVGRALLAELERHARALGRRRLILETGPRQAEALALYDRYGFRPVAAYGEYVGSPLSVCLAFDLTGVA